MMPPTKRPPKNTLKNSSTAKPASEAVNCSVIARPRIILKKTIAVASFNNDSPSTRIVNRCGAPSSLNSAITATGSVAEIRAPKSYA